MEPLWSGGLVVSRETSERLAAYRDLLVKWNPRINLVARGTIEDAWQRHIVDSAQIFPLAPPSPSRWLDFGSGAGFPGLVCAVLGHEFIPGAEFVLVESDARKAAFLNTVIRQTGINASVEVSRIEALDPMNADVISARAVAALPRLLSFAFPHLKPGGTCLFPKGARHGEEITAAHAHWCFSHEAFGSITDTQAVILKLRNIERG